MTKSYVSMEQKVCPVCAKTFDTNAILLNKRLANTLEPQTVTGWALCPEHEKLHEEGYVALVAIDPDRSVKPYTPGGVYRLGGVAHMRRSVWKDIFNCDPPEGPMVFCSEDLVERLKSMMPPDEGEAHE